MLSAELILFVFERQGLRDRITVAGLQRLCHSQKP